MFGQLSLCVRVGVALLLMSAIAHAATVQGIQGDVLINRGTGYALVTSPTELNPGDKVMVNPGGSAQVAYADGCIVQVQFGSVISIGAQSPCSIDTGSVESSTPTGGLDATTLVIGAGVVAGIGGAIYLLTDGKDDTPASP